MRNSIAVAKMIEYIDKIKGYTASTDMKSFSENTMMLEACVFCLSQMGELARTMDKEYKASYPDIPWLKVSGLRHHIVHDYEGVKVLLIWDVIENDLPKLREQLQELLS
jgi:uncharacterized protein with HEPN domain